MNKKPFHGSLVFTLLILSGILFPVYSQTDIVSGKVIDFDDKKPIQRVQVKLVEINGNKIITFTQTSKEGTFEIKREVASHTAELEFSCIGYARERRTIPSTNQPVIVELKREEVQLREIVITPPKIRQQGDTVRYRVSAFAAVNDRTIGDVLRKMPGIEVSGSGEITYQGQHLNKFYVEGSDFLGGRYGLATNNISHKDVASVEVMENHQPVKAIEDLVVSTQPAINIKLKEDAKSRWAGTLKGGGGVTDLWNAEIFTMRFKKQAQTLNTYKGSNIGIEQTDATLFSSVGDFVSNIATQLPAYIRVSPSFSGDINRNRSRFNQTNNFSTNNLFKMGNDYDFISELIASSNRQISEYSSTSIYFLNGNEISVEEKSEDTKASRKKIEGGFQLKGNKEKFYLKNNLRFNLDWDDTDMNILGTFQNRQKASMYNKKIGNDFDLLQRIGDKSITIRSINEYAEMPQQLTVTKSGANPVRQNIDLSSFYSNSSIDNSFALGNHFRLSTLGKIQFQNMEMKNRLEEDANHSTQRKFRTDIAPSLRYSPPGFNATLSLPVYYQHLVFNNKSNNFYGLNPSFLFFWDVSSSIRLSSSILFSKNLPDESLLYEGNIMSNYRNLSAGYIDFSRGQNMNASMGIRYRNVLKMLFANANLSVSRQERHRVLEQNFIGDYILNFYSPEDAKTDRISIGGSVSKGIRSIDGVVAFYPSFSHNESNLKRNGTKIPYKSDNYSLRGKINSQAFRWCDLTYEASYAYNQSQTKGQNHTSYSRFSESFTTAFSLFKPLQLNLLFEHYLNELNPGTYKNFVFSDISASYLFRDRWELALEIKNLFNERNYSYFIESESSTFYQNYRIRPRDILLNATYRF